MHDDHGLLARYRRRWRRWRWIEFGDIAVTQVRRAALVAACALFAWLLLR